MIALGKTRILKVYKDLLSDIMDLLTLLEKGDPFHSQFTDRKDGDVDNLISDVKHSRWRSEKLSGLVGLTTVVKEPLSSGASRTAKYKSLCVKESLREPSESVLGSMDELQKEISAPLFHYRDAFFTGRQTGNAKELRDLAALHALNHVLKTRNKVLKGNIKAAKDSHDEDFECRDQGFTRPKVLVILPTKQSCVKYIDSITTFAQPEQVENKKQFQERFVQGDDEFSDDKPSDFKELFGGNDDDMFRMGLKLTRKTMKYFSNFYTSDMIFASPLGLRMALDSDNKKEKDHDFLSSVEILIIDQADAILMQNWEHIEYIMEHINLQPSEAHGCDFSRVRSYYLDGNAKYFRQTIVFSGYNFPQLNRLYTQTMLNVGGKVKFTQIQPGAIIGLSIQVRQTFSRFETSSPASDPEDRFTYLTTAILPTLTRQRKGGFESQQGVLLYIPLYADFVRLRNHLATSASTQNISFGSISEYTPPQDVSRARSHFLSGRHSILLYTERAHHFRRYRIRGVQRVIMFGLPENPLFYKEIVGGYLGRTLVEGGEVAAQNGVRGLFSRFDLLKLERIVGTERFAPLLKEKGGDTFDFT